MSVASSADGIHCFAAATNGGIYLSKDGGASWTGTPAPISSWARVCCSADGANVVAVANTGSIYVTGNSGRDWKQTRAPTLSWTSAAMSSDGKTIFATAGSLAGGIYRSIDSGGTWAQIGAPAGAWSSVACSVDGTRIVAAQHEDTNGNPGTIYVSNDGGTTWGSTNAPAGSWESVASSADGTKLVVAAESAGCCGMMSQSLDGGVTWTQTNLPFGNWRSVSCSADGSTIVGVTGGGITHDAGIASGQIFASYDTGTTWTMAEAPRDRWTAVASSADGTHLVAAASSGVICMWPYSFTASSWIVTSAPSNGWHRIVCSADGSRLVALSGSYFGNSDSLIYASTNRGADWALTSAPSNEWYSIALAADGSHFAVLSADGTLYVRNNSVDFLLPSLEPNSFWNSLISSENGSFFLAASSDRLWQSTNGLNWSALNGTCSNLELVASSADGARIIGVGSGGLVYTSTNHGSSWNSSTIPQEAALDTWVSSACSADGSKWVALLHFPIIGERGDHVYLSIDGGMTWQAAPDIGQSWTAVACSADFSRLVIANRFGKIRESHDFGATWTLVPGPNEAWWSIALSADGNQLILGTQADGIFVSRRNIPPRVRISTLSTQLLLSWPMPSFELAVEESTNLLASSWTEFRAAPMSDFTHLEMRLVIPPLSPARFFRLFSQ